MKQRSRAEYASALRRKTNGKHQTLLTGLLSPAKVLEKCSADRERFWEAHTFLDALIVVREIAPFWVNYEDLHPRLASGLLRTVRHVLACHKSEGKYSGIGSIPTDWIGFLEWTPEAKRVIEGPGKPESRIATERGQLSETKQAGKTAGKGREPEANVNDCFTFPTGQALFNGKDLGVVSRFARDVLRKLAMKIDRAVRYPTLDRDSQAKEASEKLRTAVVAIRASLKRKKTGYQVTTTRGRGYCLRKKAI